MDTHALLKGEVVLVSSTFDRMTTLPNKNQLRAVALLEKYLRDLPDGDAAVHVVIGDDAMLADVTAAFGTDGEIARDDEGTGFHVPKRVVRRMRQLLASLSPLETTLVKLLGRERRWAQHWQAKLAEIEAEREQPKRPKQQDQEPNWRKRAREDLVIGGHTLIDVDDERCQAHVVVPAQVCSACDNEDGDLYLCRGCDKLFHEACGGPRFESSVQLCRDCRLEMGLESESESELDSDTTTEDHASTESSTDLSGFIVSDNEEIEEGDEEEIEDDPTTSTSSSASTSSSSVVEIKQRGRFVSGRPPQRRR